MKGLSLKQIKPFFLEGDGPTLRMYDLLLPLAMKGLRELDTFKGPYIKYVGGGGGPEDFCGGHEIF